MDVLFLPHELNISSIWIEFFLWMKYFVHVDEKYFHIASEKGWEANVGLKDILKCGNTFHNSL
jgi:hypothetical protein